MDNLKKSKLLQGVMEDLQSWDWTDNFDISQEEGEALLLVLERWDERRKYFKNRYNNNREKWIEDSKKRYYKNKQRIVEKKDD